MSNDHFVILLGGELVVNDQIIDICKHARVIAADSGILHADALKLKPELWVGDFDSAPPQTHEHHKHVEKLTFERQKDVTDGSLAMDAAIKRGAKQIDLIGAFGGERTDHMLGLMMEMMRVHATGLSISMHSGYESAWPLTDSGSVKPDLPKGSLFSILPLSNLVGLTIEGAKYPLLEASIEFGRSTTLSNVVSEDVKISLKSGKAVLIARPFDLSGI